MRAHDLIVAFKASRALVPRGPQSCECTPSYHHPLSTPCPRIRNGVSYPFRFVEPPLRVVQLPRIPRSGGAGIGEGHADRLKNGVFRRQPSAPMRGEEGAPQPFENAPRSRSPFISRLQSNQSCLLWAGRRFLSSQLGHLHD